MQRVKQQSEGVSEDDVNEIKQDISAFRYELLGVLRNNGFNTGHTDMNQKTYSRNKKRSAMAERRLKKGLPEFNIPVPESFQTTANRRTSTIPLNNHIEAKATPIKFSTLNWKKLKKKVSFKYPNRQLMEQKNSKKKSMSFDCQAGPLPSTFLTHLPNDTNHNLNKYRRNTTISGTTVTEFGAKNDSKSDTVIQLDTDDLL